MKVVAIIAAAGLGTRMRQDTPKTYLHLAGKPILLHTLEVFEKAPEVHEVLVVVHPENRLPVPVENELLRILQEALNNVGKHAKADSVDIVWNVDGGNFELTITDDGRGFETARGVRDSAYGLVGMRERADVIGAHLLIDSRPGAGTTVRVVAGISTSRSTSRPSLPMGRS